MLRRIFKTGNSLVIALPKESLQLLRLEEGSSVNVTVDLHTRRIVLEPVNTLAADIDSEFAAQLDAFIEQYRPALEELAK